MSTPPYNPHLVVKDGLVVSQGMVRAADVAVQDGLIRAVGTNLPGGSETRYLDAAGRYVLPGMIDAHVHSHRADRIQHSSTAGVHGGILTQMHFVYDDPARGVMAMIEESLEEGRAAVADFALHTRLTRPASQIAEIAEAAARGVTSFKLFMAASQPGQRIEDDDLLRIMRRIAAVDGLAIVHAENGRMIDVLEEEMRAVGRNDIRAFAGSRPPELEAEAVQRALTAGKLAGCPVYVVHMAAREALDPLRRARSAGQPVYAETCPQYLCLSDDDADRFGVLAKMAPPLRCWEDQEALWAAVRDGTIDVVGSDHNAFPRDFKLTPSGSIWEAGFGAPGCETLLQVMYQAGVVGGRIGMVDLVRVLAERPAEVFGLADRKGSIIPGLDADLVIWDPNRRHTIRAEGLHSNVFYTLFEGWECQGALDAAIQRGRVIFENGQLLAEPGDGTYLPRAGQPAALPGALAN